VPDGSSGTYRTLGLVNHLSTQGLRVHVVTVTEADIERRDIGLFDKLDTRVVVIRIPKVDIPDVFRLIRAYPSKNLNSAVKDKDIFASQEKVDTPENYFRTTSRAVRLFWFLYLPDQMIQWALKVAFSPSIRRLARSSDCIYSSGPPHSVHLAALILKIIEGKKWIADLRDPWADNPLRVLPNKSIGEKVDKFLEKKALSKADAIVCNTPITAESLRNRLKSLAGKVTWIPNGYDTELFSTDGYRGMVDAGFIRVVHVGSIYGLRDASFLLEAISRLKTLDPKVANLFHFDFTGPGANNYVSSVSEKNLDTIVSLNAPVPYGEALKKDMEATVCLCLGLRGTEIQSQVPAKLYNYIGMGKPVLALTPHNSAIALVLRESGIDYFIANPNDSNEIRIVLLDMFERWKMGKLIYGGNIIKRMRFDRINGSQSINRIITVITQE